MFKKPTYHILLLTICISAVLIWGLIYYNSIQENEKNKAYTNLSAFADLKISQISLWRKERIADGLIIKHNPVLVNQIHGFIRNPEDTSLKKEIVEWLKIIKENNEYSDIIIIKRDFTPFSLFNNAYKIHTRDTLFLNQALRSNKVFIGGIFKEISEIFLGTYIPLSLPQTEEVFGFLKIKIDPDVILYPLIESVPTSSKTAETFIVRREGDSVAFLNNLRFRKNTALELKLPLSFNNLPVVMAVKGRTGIFEGTDYDGNRVLADLNKVPDAPWYIVSKVNLDEVYAPIRTQLSYIALTVAAIIIIIFMIFYTLFRNQKLTILEEQLAIEKEKRLAEEAIRKSEQKFITIFRQSPVAKAIVDAENFITLDVNLAFEKLYGYSKEEVIGKTSGNLLLDHDIKNREQLLSLVKKSGSAEDLELDVKRKDGENRSLLINIEQIELDGKKCLLAVAQDITLRKTAEKALRESEERFRKMFEDHKAAMLIIDPDSGNVLDANASAVQFYGYSYEVLTSMKIHDINQLGPEEIEEVMQNAKLKKQNHYIFPHKLASGEVHTVEVYSSPVKIKDKHLLFSIIQDINERNLLEVQLKKTLISLQEQEAHLIEAQKLAEMGSFTIDLQNNRPIWTDQLYHVFELEPGQELTIAELFKYVYPDDLEYVKSSVQNAIENRNETLRMEFRIITKNNNLKYLDYIGRFFFDSEGKIIKSYGIIMDITKRKITELKIEELLTDLQRSNKDLEAFAYSASHDLHEPIRMIKSYSQLITMKEKDNLTAPTLEFLKFIEEGASRMQNLVSDLLQYSRISAAHKEFEPVDCNSVIKDILDDLKFKIEEEKAVIHLSSLPVIRGNRTQIRQLFQNFIQNALKFKSERLPDIRISCERKNRFWLFSVRDNGIGIEEQYFDRIFVIFQRLHGREKYPGTGIGLALCKKIIENHGGQVYVESEPGKGSIFYFTIPI